MTTTITSPVSLATLDALETLPASPKQIPATATLAELEAIRTGWLNIAKDAQIPEKLFEIGYYLGEPMKFLVHRSSGLYRSWHDADGRIEIVACQTIKGRNVPAFAWNIVRSVYAAVDDNTVLAWAWSYTGQDENAPDMPADAVATPGLYIPGEWTARALALSPKAEKTRIGIAQASTVAKRDELAGKLLVGKSI
jgi:hypothetical protein